MTSPSWPRIQVTTADGTGVTAVAPLVISASRATDIPALYGEWLLQQFTLGYTIRKNPFNGKPHYIALHDTEVIAFWSKNPRPLFHHLDFFDRRTIGYFFQFTLNDYEDDNLEPGLPPLSDRIRTLRQLSDRIGKERILWRFDPIICTDTLTPNRILEKIERVGNAVHDFVNRCTVSFLSHYTHVTRSMKRCGCSPHHPAEESIALIGKGLQRLSQQWSLPVYTCAEEVDLSRFGISRGSCIDPQYLLTTFGYKKRLTAFIENAMPAPLFPSSGLLTKKLKDPGQRSLCNCMMSKDIGSYGTCTLRCRYCYAQRGEQTG